jgi:energy-coupling factor transport system permease protein
VLFFYAQWIALFITDEKRESVKRFSPQAKIVLYVLLIITVFAASSYKITLLLLCGVAVLALRIPVSSLRRGLLPAGIFLIFTFISNVLFQEGEKLYEVLGLAVTGEGLIRGGQLTLRLLVLILGAKVLTATTRPEDLIAGMGRLLGPAGRIVFVKELVFTMSLTLRLLPIIYDEALDLYKDVKSSEGTNLAGKVKLAVSLLTPLFERSLEKARKMADTGEGV